MTLTRIIISRTDNIGDVILTLPIAGVLKKAFPGVKITFLGKSYIKPVIDACSNIDKFLNWTLLEEMPYEIQIKELKDVGADAIIHVFPNKTIARLAADVKIPIRIGTSHRTFHWFTCNHKLNLGRKKSDLHEAQLNLKLLEPLKCQHLFELDEIPANYGLNKMEVLPDEFKDLLSKEKFNLVLHPKSKGSAREWGLPNFSELIKLLPENRFKIFITGTQSEGEAMTDFLEAHKRYVDDLTGQLTLDELISFIRHADGLVAASTGPLHIASALGKYAVGVYAPMRPIHPGRWAPIGLKAKYLVLDKECEDCRNTMDCECIRSITPKQITESLTTGHEEWVREKATLAQ